MTRVFPIGNTLAMYKVQKGQNMFFWKKKTSEKAPETKEDINAISEEEKAKLCQEIQSIEEELKKNLDVELLEKVADLYSKIGDVDNAIRCYEKKLTIDNTITSAYRELPKLYNIKRQEAAQAKDAEKVQYYLVKLDEILNMSKDKVRGKI